MEVLPPWLAEWYCLRPAVMFLSDSSQGGMDIEAVAEENPEEIHVVSWHPVDG